MVLAQFQNRFFVEHLPVAAYAHCLKEKEMKEMKWCVFIVLSLTFFSVALQGSVGEIRTN